MPFDKNKFHLDWVWQKVISLCTSNWKKRKEKNNKHRAVSFGTKQLRVVLSQMEKVFKKNGMELSA